MSDWLPSPGDDRLRDGLRRRVSRASLTGEQRGDILRNARLRALPRARATRWMHWLRPVVAGLAGMLILAVVLSPLLLTSPAAPTAPPVAPSASPVAPSGAPTAAPTTGIDALRVYSAQELADMVDDPAWEGRSVLAQARLVPADYPDTNAILKCGGPDLCRFAEIEGVDRQVRVLVGWRDAAPETGQPYADDSGTHWLTRLSIPAQAGVFAFAVGADHLEFLGPMPDVADVPMDVGTARTIGGGPSDAIFLVRGWLVQTAPVSCPVPEQGLQTPQPAFDYYCTGSWLTRAPERAINDGNFRLDFPGAIHVQNDAYNEYAAGPGQDEQGSVPREGIYLIRNAGCPVIVWGDCPVYRMLGRIDGAKPQAERVALPTATPSE